MDVSDANDTPARFGVVRSPQQKGTWLLRKYNVIDEEEGNRSAGVNQSGAVPGAVDRADEEPQEYDQIR